MTSNTLIKSKSSERIINILIIALAAISIAGSDLFTPALPAIAHDLQISSSLSQLTVAVFLAGFSVSQLFYGILSDGFGRKPILITGLCIYCIGSVLLVFSYNIDSLLIARLIQGLGIGAGVTLVRIMLRDLYSGIELAKRGSINASVIALAPAVAPALGSTMQTHFGYRSNFDLLLISGIAITLLCLIFIPETNQYKHRKHLKISTIKANFKTILTTSTFWINVLIAGLAFSTVMITAIINPFILQKSLHVPTSEYGLYALIGAAGFFVGMLSNYKLLNIWTPNRIIGFGIALLLIGGLGLTITGLLGALSIAAVITPTFIIALAAGWIMPNCFFGAFGPFATIAGTVGALYGTFQQFNTAIMSSLASLIPHHNQLAMGLFIIALSLIASGLYAAAKLLKQSI